MRGEAEVLKEELRLRLSEPAILFANGIGGAPTMGASEAFEGDIEAAARTVLQEAGGRRAKAKELLRQRTNGNGAANGKLNGSEVGYWRQLGALSLLDNTQDALAAYGRAADLAPRDAEAQMLVGVLHLRTGNLAAAESAFRRQIELGNADGASFLRYRGHTMLGDVHAAREEHDAAMAAYAEAQREVKALLERDPDNAGFKRDYGVKLARGPGERMCGSMSWQPSNDPVPGNARSCDAIEHVIVPRARDLGGFEVRRALPAAQKQMVGPFIFFDQMGPAEFLIGKGIDVRPHPHIGLATVTYLFEGEVFHRDSLGTALAIKPGEVNLMTAGRGIVHSERERSEVKQAPHRLLRHPGLGGSAQDPRGGRAGLRPSWRGGAAAHYRRGQARAPGDG